MQSIVPARVARSRPPGCMVAALRRQHKKKVWTANASHVTFPFQFHWLLQAPERVGCGGARALVQARRRPGKRLAPGLARWGWWWATVELSGLVVRLGNSGQVEDGRDLRLAWVRRAGPSGTPAPRGQPFRALEAERPQSHQEVARRENSFRDTVP